MDYAIRSLSTCGAAYRETEMPGGDKYLALLALWSGDFPKARQAWSDANRKYPEYRYGPLLAAEIEFFARNWGEAERRYTALLDQKDVQTKLNYFGAVRIESALATIRQQLGDSNGMQKWLAIAETKDKNDLTDSPANPRLLYNLAASAAIRGKSDESLNYLKQAIANGWVEHRSTRLDPRFESFRNQSVFQQLLQTTDPAHGLTDAFPPKKIPNSSRPQ